jgi:uncharacterized protein (UPF0147 family)
MPRYKRQETDFFKQIDSRYLEQFTDLDRKTQRQIIKGLMKIAQDPQVPKQEREIARDRVRQLKKVVT